MAVGVVVVHETEDVVGTVSWCRDDTAENEEAGEEENVAICATAIISTGL